MRPAYITNTRSTRRRDHTQVVGDPDDRHGGLRLKGIDEVEDLLLDCDVEGGGRLVCHEEARRGGNRRRDHHPLGHPARELVRIRRLDSFGVGETHLTQHLAGPLAGS